MDSGDLAYWADGEVYVTGRKKDIIIKAGHNIAPQEVEAAAAEVAGVRRGCVSAFGTLDRDSGTEKLVVVAETRTADRQEMAGIRAQVVKKRERCAGTASRPRGTCPSADYPQDLQRKDPAGRDSRTLRERQTEGAETSTLVAAGSVVVRAPRRLDETGRPAGRALGGPCL